MFVSVMVVKLHQKSLRPVNIYEKLKPKIFYALLATNEDKTTNCSFNLDLILYGLLLAFQSFIFVLLFQQSAMFNRDEAPAYNKPTYRTSHQPHAGKSGTFNADFLPRWGKERGV